MTRARIEPGAPGRPDPLPAPKWCPCCKAKLVAATRKIRVDRGRTFDTHGRKYLVCSKCKVRVVLHRFPPKLSTNDQRTWNPAPTQSPWGSAGQGFGLPYAPLGVVPLSRCS